MAALSDVRMCILKARGEPRREVCDMRKENVSPQMMREKLKYEAADELGLLDKVLEGGWGALTAEETGRIGGMVARSMRAAGEPGND